MTRTTLYPKVEQQLAEEIRKAWKRMHGARRAARHAGDDTTALRYEVMDDQLDLRLRALLRVRRAAKVG